MNSRNHLLLNGSFPQRTRMDALATAIDGSSLITIAAPPGYGKTHAIASIASSYKNRAICVTLPKLDCSPAKFWKLFKEFPSPELRSFARRISKFNFPDSPDKFDAFLSCLSEEAARRPILIAVDDCDNISDEEVALFLEHLTESSPKGVRLVLSASTAHRLVRFEKLDRKDLLLRLTTDDLKLTPDEALALVRAHGWHIAPHDIEKILTQTEGWPLAFFHSCKDRASPCEIMGFPDCRLPDTNELFQSDYFEDFGKNIRSVLLKLAQPPCFSVDIAKELSPENIDETIGVLRTNPFVIRLSRTESTVEMLRFHRMYRGFLLSRSFLLEEGERKDARISTGTWFKSQGMYKEAIESYRSAKEFGLALKTLGESPKGGRKDLAFAQYIIDFLERLPEPYKNDDAINLSKAMYYMNNLEIDAAQEILLGIVSRQDARKEGEKAIQGEAYAILADIDMLKNDRHFAEYVKLSAALMPNGSKIQNNKVMAVGNDYVFFLSENKKGAAGDMVDLIFETTPLVEKVFNCRKYGYEWLFAAEASYLTLDMEKAKENCYRAIYKASSKEQHDIICNSRYLLSRIAAFHGNLAEAKGHLSDISLYVEERKLIELYGLRDTAWAWFYILVRDPLKVAPWIAKSGENDYVRWPTPSSRRTLIRAFYLISTHNYHEAIALLAQMEDSVPGKGLCVPGIFSTVMRSECHLRLGDREGAVRAIYKAYEKSYKASVTLPFVELGNTMRTIIDNIRRLDAEKFDPNWLDNIQLRSGSFAKKHASFVRAYNQETGGRTESTISLTNREQEVLGFLASGMTREEIGDYMHISVNGVKKHISGIYNKLGALNRADAIKIASDLGMI